MPGCRGREDASQIRIEKTIQEKTSWSTLATEKVTVKQPVVFLFCLLKVTETDFKITPSFAPLSLLKRFKELQFCETFALWSCCLAYAVYGGSEDLNAQFAYSPTVI